MGRRGCGYPQPRPPRVSPTSVGQRSNPEII